MPKFKVPQMSTLPIYTLRSTLCKRKAQEKLNGDYECRGTYQARKEICGEIEDAACLSAFSNQRDLG